MTFEGLYPTSDMKLAMGSSFFFLSDYAKWKSQMSDFFLPELIKNLFLTLNISFEISCGS